MGLTNRKDGVLNLNDGVTQPQRWGPEPQRWGYRIIQIRLLPYPKMYPVP